MGKNRLTAKEIFDSWAKDYRADWMEKGHRRSVMEAFKFICVSKGNYLEIGFGNGYGIDKAVSLLYPGGMLIVLVDYYKEHKESLSWSGGCKCSYVFVVRNRLY